MRDKRVLFRVPIEGVCDEGGRLALEVDEEEIGRLAGIYSIAANERRLRIMLELMRRKEMQFSDLLEVAENPKLVSDCMKPLMEEGMVVHKKWGSSYKTTATGAALALVMTTGLAKLLEFLEEEAQDEDLE